MVCEDDVAYCRGARSAWERSVGLLNSVGFWSLYTPRRDRELVGHSSGWVASNRGRDTWGTQCMCFPRASAELVLNYEPLHNEDQMRGPTDAIVAQCFVDKQLPCYYHNPSLADHLGQVSSVGHNWYEDHVGFEFNTDFEPFEHGAELTKVSPSSVPEQQVHACRAAVVTVFQNNIPQEVVSAQAEVICRFLPKGCEFIPVEVSHHALGLDDFFRELRHDAYVIFDIDCIPLDDWVIPWMLHNALAGVVVGPAQRANHLENGGHIYAGPSALAFSRNTFDRIGRISFGDTLRGDVAEEITYACERLGIPITLLWPTAVEQPRWSLRPGLSFGNGTTYGGAVFHAFSISKGDTVGIFLEKCRRILNSSPFEPGDDMSSATSSQPAVEAVTLTDSSSSVSHSSPVFHEMWYSDAELERLAEAVRLSQGQSGKLIELGSWEGRSTAVIANACFPEVVWAVDTWAGAPTQGTEHETVRLARERDVFSVFQQNMQAMTRGNVVPRQAEVLEFLQVLEGPIRFCHIDAAHDYESVRDSLRLLIPKLIQGSVLFGHDYESAHAGRSDLNGGGERAVREVLPGHTAIGNTWIYIHKVAT